MPDILMHDPAGGDHAHSGAYERPGGSAYRATGVLAETIPRNVGQIGTVNALATGRMALQLIYLDAGITVTSISFQAWATAASVPLNQWFSLYSLALGKLAVTVDDTTTAWGAFTTKTLALSAPYVVPTAGLYYVGCMVTATTVPSLAGITQGANNGGLAPRVLGYDATNTGLTTPATAPATAAALSGVTSVALAWIT